MGASGDEDEVAILAVGDAGGILFQPEVGPVALDRTLRRPQIAAAALGRGRGDQQLLAGDPAHHVAVPVGLDPVLDQARQLDHMHGVNHRRGRAGLPEDGADFGDLDQRGALAPQIHRDHHAQKTLRLQGFDGFGRKPVFRIDPVGHGTGDLAGAPRPGD